MNYDQASARCWAEIDLGIVEANYASACRISGDKTKVIPVLKANAYGLGAARIARLLAEKGADLFAVAELFEALEVQKACGKDVLVMGMIPDSQMEIAVQSDVIATLFSVDMAKKLDSVAAAQGKKARAHIKIDTGLHRLGLNAETALEEAKEILALENLKIEGIFTHLALRNKVSDDLQIARLTAVAEGLRAEGIDFGILHAGDSIGMVRYPEYRFDAVRTGAWLYGVVPNRCPNPEDCNMPARFLTRIVQLRRVKAGECLGYDDDHPLDHDALIATLSCGYADGYPRVNSVGEVEVRGHRAPIAGLVCMDQFTIDVTDVPGVQVGDAVTLLGGGITLNECAAWTKSNRNELLTRFGRRVPRVYMRNGVPVEIDNEGAPLF